MATPSRLRYASAGTAHKDSAGDEEEEGEGEVECGDCVSSFE